MVSFTDPYVKMIMTHGVQSLLELAGFAEHNVFLFFCDTRNIAEYSIHTLINVMYKVNMTFST